MVFRYPPRGLGLFWSAPLVGNGLASDDAPWLAIVNRAAASSRRCRPDPLVTDPRGSASSPANSGAFPNPLPPDLDSQPSAQTTRRTQRHRQSDHHAEPGPVLA